MDTKNLLGFGLIVVIEVFIFSSCAFDVGDAVVGVAHVVQRDGIDGRVPEECDNNGLRGWS